MHKPLHIMDITHGHSSSINKNDESTMNESVIVDPLFMDGLPPDFKTNPGLSAIASLLHSDDNDDNDDTGNHDNEDSIDEGVVGKNETTDEDDEDDDGDNEGKLYRLSTNNTSSTKNSMSGGGKVMSSSSSVSQYAKTKRSSSKYRSKPYRSEKSPPINEKQNNSKRRSISSSIGETQLFLDLWKL